MGECGDPCWRIVPLGRIIPAHEAGLYADAAAARVNARNAASRVIRAARHEAAAIREAARLDGEQEGRGALATTLLEAPIAVQAVLDALEGEIADAIAAGVEAIIGSFDVGEGVARAAKQAVAELRDRHGVTLYVAPSVRDAVARGLHDYADIRIEINSTLVDDACEIHTRAGHVRAGLTQQLDALRSALRKAAGR